MKRLAEGHSITTDPANFTECGRTHVEMGYVAQHEAAVGYAGRLPTGKSR